MRQQHEAQKHTKAALALVAERMKWYYNKSVQKVLFKAGDKAMLDLRDYQKMEHAL